jgi:hypothetical protein
MQSEQFGQLTFNEAFPSGSLPHPPRARHRHDYEKNFKRLTPSSAAAAGEDPHRPHPRVRRRRKPTTGPSRINHEISTVQQMLKRAGLWAPIASWYEPLPLPRTGPGIALEPPRKSTSSPWPATRSALARGLLLLADHGEHDRRSGRDPHAAAADIDLDERVLHVRDGAKNKYRVRALPLNDDALWALQQLVERAGPKGASSPTTTCCPRARGIR